MKNVDDDSLSATDDLVLVFNVRQLYLGMGLSQLGPVDIEPLILCLVDVFSLFVRY